MSHKTKIVCTIGPACSDEETLRQMMLAGMNVARFNMSHGTHESHRALIDKVKKVRFELGLPVSIMIDTKGPEVRIKQFKNGKIKLAENQEFALTTENVMGDETIVAVTYDKFTTIVKPGTRILLNDGLIELVADKVTDKVVYTKVVAGGELSNNKSINLPSVELNMEYLSETDKKDLAFGVEEQAEVFSISFVNHAQDVIDVRNYLKSLGDNDAFIIAKVESEKGVENLDEIIDVADGVMVARGDLGVEINFEKLPHIQKIMLDKSKNKGKYSITATQMLESMISSPRPTRAEISDVANAIFDGTSAIMLSGETSAGKYPVQAVETMRKIAEETEKNINYGNELANYPHTNDVTCGIGYGACALSTSLNAKAILVTTNSGNSAESISRFRPACDIVALTPNFESFNRLGMFWGVTPLLDKVHYDTDALLRSARLRSKQAKLVKNGDLVIQTAGIMTGIRGSNTLVVAEITEGDDGNE